MSTHTFEIAGQAIPAGTRQVVRIPVTVDLDGGEIALYVHVLVGSRPGRTLVCATGHHGDEWLASDTMRRLVERVEPSELAGTLLVLPVCSPTAFGALTRISQVSSDSPDLNRAFPGTWAWIPDQMARAISTHVLPLADALIDYHFGIWGTGIGYVGYVADAPDPAQVELARTMALAYGYPLVARGQTITRSPGPRSIAGYAAATFGTAAILAEIGVAGFGSAYEDRYVDLNIRGTRGVMQALGMLKGTPPRAERIMCFEKSHRVEPTKGGLLVPEREPDELGREVKRGELLARIVSPYTHETLEELTSPCDGRLHLIARTYPVRPGDWAFGVADSTDAGTEWITT
ncbi:MAG: succinylglutamate desuccinylase/aspartoacylase family protein [Chloroflexi bacterium]|nr:succinylglutamate desuccinylase/aspartoacylase family protein [Chloroflexota bacterium]